MENIYGRTLIELLTTLAIISITLIIGIPTINQSLQYNNEKIILNTLYHLSFYTRTQAIKKNNYFTLCPSTDRIHCNGQWNNLLIVFSDHNKNEIVDGADILYRIHAFDIQTPCIMWNQSKRQYLQFKPSGASNGTAGHFKFCDSVNRVTKNKVVVSFNGRTSIKNL